MRLGRRLRDGTELGAGGHGFRTSSIAGVRFRRGVSPVISTYRSSRVSSVDTFPLFDVAAVARSAAFRLVHAVDRVGFGRQRRAQSYFGTRTRGTYRASICFRAVAPKSLATSSSAPAGRYGPSRKARGVVPVLRRNARVNALCD
jgi:hypothetical protein